MAVYSFFSTDNTFCMVFLSLCSVYIIYKVYGVHTSILYRDSYLERSVVSSFDSLVVQHVSTGKALQ